MSKKTNVAEVISEITSPVNPNGKKTVNRFSQKKFEQLLTAMANDKDFKAVVAKVKGGELAGTEEIATSDIFRNYIKKVLEKAGMDKEESKKVLDADYTFDHMDGFYELFASALYAYMDAGNRFDLMPTEDFKGSIFVRSNAKSSRTQNVHHPRTKEDLGTVRIDKSPYKSIATKSPCPSYLKKKTKIK